MFISNLYKSQSYFKPQLFARMERYFSLNIHQNNSFLLIREIFDNQTVQTTNFFFLEPNSARKN